MAWIDNYLMVIGDWSTSGRVNSCKVSSKIGCSPWNKRPTLQAPSLAWKKADVYKINAVIYNVFHHIYPFEYGL